MACKPPIMAHRKRPGTSGGNSMAAPGPVSCPTPHPTEPCDLKTLPPRQRPVRYPKESHDPKPLPRSCKAQYSSPKSQDIGRNHSDVDVDTEVEVKRYSNQADAELEDQRPATPSTPEHEHDQDDHEQADFHGGGDSLDDDSSSDYINNTSDDEEDYDDGLAEEDEGVTYYIRYCPEDDSYLEGMDCSSQGECNHSHSHSQGDCASTMQPVGPDTDECQEAVEGWVEEGEAEGEVREEEWVEDEEGEGAVREEWREEEEEVREEWREGDEDAREEWREEGQVMQEQWVGRERHRVEEWAEGEGEVRCEVVEQDPDEQIYNGRPEPILDHHHHHHLQPSLQDTLCTQDDEEEAESEEYCPNEEEDEEGEEEERHGRAYTGDYYAPEDNGNSVRVSPYRGRKVLVVEGETGEEAEEDIDQIVAEIKMSMSMGSLSSGTDQSPDELAQDPAPSDYPHAKPDAAPYPPAHHRHDSRPKSLNLPSMHHNNPDIQRAIKAHPRSPEDRQRWAQEQVSNGAEQPRKQQRSDLNVPLENNNVPEPTKKVASFPSFVDVPGPCEPEDLIDGIIFAANYLGSTQLLSERNPSKNIRMMQAQEAVSRVKRVQKAAKIKKKASADGDAQTLTEVDLFISTQRIKVLNADSQETMMDNALRTISYIADIGNIVVLMARRRMPRTASQDCIETTPGAPEAKKQYKMICHVFESEDAQLIAQSIGQAFSVAYQEFLRANGINPEDLSQKEYSDIINTQEMYNDDLIHFSNSENCKELQLEKSKGEILGVVIVESGWGSILPTVILANMMNGGPAARSGKLSIGDQIMSINNTSLVGLPLATCQGIIKGLKNQVQVKMNIVSCPPVTTVLIKRPDLKYQLGFSVQNGIICSLMRGGIAERGGVRVGHRIIEINGQSVVATAHEKIVQALSNSVGEIHMKTMPAAMFRLLTGQETPLYI
ncbi:amyloid-beta A4 precursor protein-binding family A member 2 isoform X1 [Seriola aureovittata]|uniref:amyloid-beta A4 precursor protein-binding family A member 2 isoform X1 n=1 Tax=Seriola aureovittata TaxID=2871759 RepID=UPI0024BEDD02|nr:amyloid-beta A4 precursor protein-binding family A member 2 isoform X1 [Seriola aureovittata]XP_056241201.1 amyloid-beta A4 precursor protein-binding family A member 2 isoform X1 [Seriola aureovittata]XP_056241993.1 amyloid-beta A4 precursor protein-binding family A member 2 isoform X1 [Seriola aureovittata]XP_056242762.1 amyloid-beta A4 precursor protein-binding family A member 2 isoform X1 [Seriola aureovittata]XP_056243589.1 amyloid-beta A4 precursor protein-binding family A member 2 isof